MKKTSFIEWIANKKTIVAVVLQSAINEVRSISYMAGVINPESLEFLTQDGKPDPNQRDPAPGSKPDPEDVRQLSPRDFYAIKIKDPGKVAVARFVRDNRIMAYKWAPVTMKKAEQPDPKQKAGLFTRGNIVEPTPELNTDETTWGWRYHDEPGVRNGMRVPPEDAAKMDAKLNKAKKPVEDVTEAIITKPKKKAVAPAQDDFPGKAQRIQDPMRHPDVYWMQMIQGHPHERVAVSEWPELDKLATRQAAHGVPIEWIIQRKWTSEETPGGDPKPPPKPEELFFKQKIGISGPVLPQVDKRVEAQAERARKRSSRTIQKDVVIGPRPAPDPKLRPTYTCPVCKKTMSDTGDYIILTGDQEGQTVNTFLYCPSGNYKGVRARRSSCNHPFWAPEMLRNPEDPRHWRPGERGEPDANGQPTQARTIQLPSQKDIQQEIPGLGLAVADLIAEPVKIPASIDRTVYDTGEIQPHVRELDPSQRVEKGRVDTGNARSARSLGGGED